MQSFRSDGRGQSEGQLVWRLELRKGDFFLGRPPLEVPRLALPLATIKPADESAYGISQAKKSFVPPRHLPQRKAVAVQYERVPRGHLVWFQGEFDGRAAGFADMKEMQNLPSSRAMKFLPQITSNRRPGRFD
jgi:hypothetical protein